MNEIAFAEKLLKGRIVETIFEQMMRLSEKYTVLRFGYENTSPELAQYQHLLRNKHIIQKLRHAPDFLLISQDKSEAYFVEVKYRNHLDSQEILEVCDQVLDHVDPAWLFIATPHGFYFSPCNEIKNHNGYIEPMHDRWVDARSQDAYVELLNRFIPK